MMLRFVGSLINTDDDDLFVIGVFLHRNVSFDWPKLAYFAWWNF